jgi:sugar/nucleoside kinase (ribokinase family)
MILNVSGEDRRYIHSIGANADLRVADGDFPHIERCRVLYVGGYLATPGISADDLTRLFRAASEKSVITVLDVAIPVGASVSLERLAPVLPYTNYFLPNQDETRVLTGEADVIEQLQCLTRLSPDCTVVITRGDQGSLAKHGSTIIETAAFPVVAVDESGAGDAFAAGFITGILEQWPLDYTLRFAGATGASCTRAFGCHDGVSAVGETHQMISEPGIQLQKTVCTTS